MEVTALADLTETPHAEVFENRDPRTVRLQLGEGESVLPHTHPETHVVLHLLSGRPERSLDGETHEVVAGELVQFSGDREVSPRAVEPATAVLVFAPQ